MTAVVRYAAAVNVEFGGQRHRVLQAVARAGSATSDAVAQRLGLSPNQVATRLLELRTGGYLVRQRDDDGEYVTRPTSSGRRGIVHVLTPVGVRLLRDLEDRRDP